jgi:hypothetical protein
MTGDDREVVVYDRESEQCVARKQGHGDVVYGTIVNPQNPLEFTTFSKDGSLALWTLEANRPPLSPVTSSTQEVVICVTGEISKTKSVRCNGVLTVCSITSNPSHQRSPHHTFQRKKDVC